MTARTYKQAAFIESLLSDRLATFGVSTLAEATAAIHLDDLTVKDAKTVIERLLALPKDPDPTMLQVVADSPRSGVNGREQICSQCNTLVAAGAGHFYKGDRGFLVAHKVGECVEAENTGPAVPLVEATEGVFVVENNPDDEYDLTLYRVYRTKNGHLACKTWKHGSWVYVTGGVAMVRAFLTAGTAHAMTAAEASEFGTTNHRCVACPNALSDPRSQQVGYGPVCAEKYGWPWG